MSILFLIGKNLENISVIEDLLNENKYKGRPLYKIADEKPLILYDCLYNNINFIYEQDATIRLYDHFKRMY